MSADIDKALLIVGIAGLGLTVYAVFGKGGATDKASNAGAWFANNVINPILTAAKVNPVSVETTALAGKLQGHGTYYLDTQNIPTTPEGYNTSNWTWIMPDGTLLGLPAGMTPLEFASANPNSPISAKIMQTDDSIQSNNFVTWLSTFSTDVGLRW